MKNVVLYEIYRVKSRVTILMSIDCIYRQIQTEKGPGVPLLIDYDIVCSTIIFLDFVPDSLLTLPKSIKSKRNKDPSILLFANMFSL